MGQKTETAADVFTGLGWVAVIAAGSLVTVLGVSTLGSYGFGGVTEAALEFADMQNPEVVGAAKNLGFFVGAVSALLILSGSQRIRDGVKEMVR